jgi:hypothetical protein
MSDYQKQAREEMEAAGIRVEPSAAGGFRALNVPNCDSCWAATEESTWAMAWGFFKMNDPQPDFQSNPPPNPS